MNPPAKTPWPVRDFGDCLIVQPKAGMDGWASWTFKTRLAAQPLPELNIS